MCYSNFSRSFSRTKHSPGELLDLLDTDPPKHIGAPFRFGSMADRSSDTRMLPPWRAGVGQEQFVNLRPDKHGMEITPEKLQIRKQTTTKIICNNVSIF